tara:strand:- start:494 stop:1105 length:612 start_codon:yes stop_codon:yes gene_type:complete
MVIPNEKFIIGLGNPGKRYSNTRHNIGFQFIEKFSDKYNSHLTLKTKIRSFYSEFYIDENKYRLFMPNTFMNNSGDAIRAIVDWYGIEINQLLIIIDDIDLPFGKIRMKLHGGSGGHNGLKSIINKLNTDQFTRIRIGIGSPPSIDNEKKFNTISHVLGNLSNPEKLTLTKIFNKIIESIEKLDQDNQNSIICELNSFKSTDK